ncbi:MAG: DUF6600 domain-containing protein [Limisphaerales bacterium]
MNAIYRKAVGAAVSALLVSGLWWQQNVIAQTPPPPDQGTVTADNTSLQTELPSDVDPNSPLAQVIHLAQSGVDESVLISYAGNSATPFNLTADQIVYLKDIGVPDTVVQSMIQRDQQLGAADNTAASPETAPETAPPTGDVTSDYFYGSLAPYGGWINVSGYGLCWRPDVVNYNADWQPYCDHGHWVYTDEGWYWMSDYSWGWAAFHYGRWFHDAHQGWCWWPDTAWAPSWVCWRYSDSYCGWAPLPPNAIYRAGVGFVFNGVTVNAGFDFGISAGFFAFVPIGNFYDPHPARYRVDRTRNDAVYRQTTVINNFEARGGIFVNHGIDPQRITQVTHTPIQAVAIREDSSPVARGQQLGNGQLTINRPRFTGTEINNLHQGVAPRRTPGQSAWYTTTQPQPNNMHRETVNPGNPQYRNPSPPFNPNEANRQMSGNSQQPSPMRPEGTQPVRAGVTQQQPPAYAQPPVNRNPVEIPQRVPSSNEQTVPHSEPVSQAPETHYPENQEPVPQYNNSSGERYNTPRAQGQTPRETAPERTENVPPATQGGREQRVQPQQSQPSQSTSRQQQQWPGNGGH